MGLGETGKEDREGKEEEVNAYLLDTHVWLWTAQHAVKDVSANFFTEVEEWQRAQAALLSPISAWELGMLAAANQLILNMPVEELWARTTQRDRLGIADLTALVLLESTRLPGDIHRDPADRILIATAREYGLTLVTRDWRILDYAKQGYLKARKP
jgi:PIN domain nuclease of toxin-antitoxin system